MTIETSEGIPRQQGATSAGTGKSAGTGAPVQPVRKVFALLKADGRYSTKNRFPAFTGEMPNGDQYYGFPAENDELKIANTMVTANTGSEERKPFAAAASDGVRKHFLSCVMYCWYRRLFTWGGIPMIIRRTRILLSMAAARHENTLVITGPQRTWF